MRYAKRVPNGARISWKRVPGKPGFPFWDDRISGNRSNVPVQLRNGRGLLKSAILWLANLLHKWAY